MESRESRAVPRDLQTLFSVGAVAALSDGELLERFVGRSDEGAEAAFAALVERHGPMVLRVGLGVLHDQDAAEDAFQATFLILARKAGLIRNRASVASWLFGVARRVAGRAKVDRARRTAHERRHGALAGSQTDDPASSALVPEVQEEVDRLPEKYRAPIVLCYFEGLSVEEAAGRLRAPAGTVKVRLARARGRLRARLVRRGLAPAALASAFSRSNSGAIAASLVDSTIKAAVRILSGQPAGVSTAVVGLLASASRSLLMSRLKIVLLTLASLSVLATGAGLLAQQTKSGRVAPLGGGADPLAKDSVPLDPAIRALVEARAKTASDIFGEEIDRYHNTLTIFPGDTVIWSRRWMEDSLRLSSRPSDRLTAIQDHLERLKYLERIATNYALTGQGRQSDSLRVTYFRLEAEQSLAEGRAAYPNVPLPAPKPFGANRAQGQAPPPPPPPRGR